MRGDEGGEFDAEVVETLDVFRSAGEEGVERPGEVERRVQVRGEYVVDLGGSVGEGGLADVHAGAGGRARERVVC